ncbi:hypothetical protein [Streptomyces sp. NPDC058694]|uniref:hypothetical protein n=1 Tax=Streptomyces sp. NPDC058694 TaxID=3346603 RepID=UPI00366248FE
MAQDIGVGAEANPFGGVEPVGRADGDVDGGAFGLRQLGTYRYRQPYAVRVVVRQRPDDVDGDVEVGRQHSPVPLVGACCELFGGRCAHGAAADHFPPVEALDSRVSYVEKKVRAGRVFAAGLDHGRPADRVIGVVEQAASGVLGQQDPLAAGRLSKVRVLVIGEPCDQARSRVAAERRVPADFRIRIGEQALLRGQGQWRRGDSEPVGSDGQTEADAWIGIVHEPGALFRRYGDVLGEQGPQPAVGVRDDGVDHLFRQSAPGKRVPGRVGLLAQEPSQDVGRRRGIARDRSDGLAVTAISVHGGPPDSPTAFAGPQIVRIACVRGQRR